MTDHATRTTARLFDFLHRRTPWHRRLWGIGTVLGLHEVVEYSRIRREASLPPDGLKYVAASMRRAITLDPAATPFVRDLDEILARGDRISSHDENKLEHLARRVDDGYLERWIAAVAAGQPPPVERMSRSVASHLLDKGFSSDHLYRWLDADRHRNPQPDLARVLAEAELMCRTTAARSYEVLVPCFIPGDPTRLPPAVRWLDAEETAATLDKLSPGRRKPRQGGAFAIQVTERDPWAAVEAANELIARVAARVQVGRPGADVVRTAGVAYVTGNGASSSYDRRDDNSMFMRCIVKGLSSMSIRPTPASSTTPWNWPPTSRRAALALLSRADGLPSRASSCTSENAAMSPPPTASPQSSHAPSGARS